MPWNPGCGFRNRDSHVGTLTLPRHSRVSPAVWSIIRSSFRLGALVRLRFSVPPQREQFPELGSQEERQQDQLRSTGGYLVHWG
ncbi:hypothetical protein M5D96_002824 [Drosophila gunungcola]|uniref:Uncharacterized protein n=1 Tax=Drosophila gunungcola TaxID=103775 RepID=A0A9P9Z1H4_9MUSC|nr:hypothetical protein M5D96_002824 [Drosophila gunungcola]